MINTLRPPAGVSSDTVAAGSGRRTPWREPAYRAAVISLRVGGRPRCHITIALMPTTECSFKAAVNNCCHRALRPCLLSCRRVRLLPAVVGDRMQTQRRRPRDQGGPELRGCRDVGLPLPVNGALEPVVVTQIT